MKHLGISLLLLFTVATGAVAYLVDKESLLSFDTPLKKFLLILLVILASSIITKTGVWLIQRYAKNKAKAELKQLTSVYRYSVVIILAFIILVLLYGVIGPAITSIGLLAAGLTFALQRPILNLAGWFLIVSKRPFKIGDRVEIGSVGGDVHDIALMHTHLSLVQNEEPTGKVVYIPNEQVLTQQIINSTKGSALVWDHITVRVPPTANIASVEKKLAQCASEVVGKEMREAAKSWKADVKPETRTLLEYTAGLKPHLEISVRYLANAKEVGPVKTEITKKIIEKFRKELQSQAG